ncbi:lipopolysaccharide biosynthesis protein RfbH [Sulfurovum sp. NBC37-1]|uniref:lipopolysaccharide biosynthesis protein RfbH n=1 Tax=Sulfurovum sp. (strain NBC37-1) TaxID=387093 RepID=UPI0001587BD7|nr:lipopolysaccharide biosynthesis protein RfbH [Sulfurovum sp. NBC37-1]BAF73084.1 aminotransferase [Sulfurovum sp. NBC37-1]
MKKQAQLKQEIFHKIKEYYQLVHKPEQQKEFIEGNNRVNYAGRVFDEKEIINLVDSSLDFWLTYGKYSKKFEAELSNFLGIRWSLLVNSGSSANLLAFYALTSPLLKDRQIQRGDEVITVAAGFPTTISPIVQYGAVPVFVDMELTHFNIDTTQLEKALSSKTKAIMLAHTLGNPFDIKAVKAFCNKHNLWLIEDNCDALGSKYNGQYTGTWGDIGTSSFYPPHHITMGEGGAVYTNNSLLKKILLSMRDWGRDCWCESGVDNTCGARFSQQFGKLPKGYDHKYVYSHFGFNLKPTDMQAAIGVAQLEKLPDFTYRRIENYQRLYDGLSNIKELVLVRPQRDSQPSWFGFLMTLSDNANFSRNQLSSFLEKNLIQTRNLFTGNILRHPLFDSLVKNRDYRTIGDLPNTDKIMNDSFWIGLYPGMGKEQIDYMIKTIRGFISQQ